MAQRRCQCGLVLRGPQELSDGACCLCEYHAPLVRSRDDWRRLEHNRTVRRMKDAAERMTPQQRQRVVTALDRFADALGE